MRLKILLLLFVFAVVFVPLVHAENDGTTARERMQNQAVNAVKNRIANANQNAAGSCAEAQDRIDCLQELRVQAVNAFQVRTIAYECKDRFVNDEDGKLRCMRALREELKNARIDCGLFENEEAQARCRVCTGLEDVNGRDACLTNLQSCLANAVNGSNLSINSCVRQLKEEDANNEACKEKEGDERRECLREKFQVRGIKDCATAANRLRCYATFRPAVIGYLRNQFREFVNAVRRLEASGYLTDEDVTKIKEYLEQKRNEFEAAATSEEKKAIIEEVQAKWKEYKEKLKNKTLEALKNRAQAIKVRIRNLERISERLKEAGYNDTPRLDAAITKGEALLDKVQEANTLPELRTALRRAFAWLQYTHRLIIAIKEGKPLPQEPSDEEATPTPTAEATSTPEPTATEEPSPTVTATPTSTPEPTETPEPTATEEPTATPTETPSPTPTEEPTPSPTP